MYQHRHTCRRLLSLSLGALDIAMAWENIPVEASGSTRVGTSFSLHPTLSIVLAISFGYFLASDLALYHTYVFYHHHDTIEEDLENERKIKNQTCPQTQNFHVPVRCVVCTGSRSRKVQVKCFIRPATAQFYFVHS